MNEYISKEFMLKNLEDDKMNNAEHCEPVTIQIMERFIRYVKEFPAADVQPVVHAEWICHEPEIGLYYSCSKCGHNALQGMYKFCPNCGAKMDGGETL